jgi:proteasome activator subunit 4
MENKFVVCLTTIHCDHPDCQPSVSLARIVVYSMAPDSVAVPASNAPTPLFSPLPSRTNTPEIQTSTLGEYLSAPLGKKGTRKFLGGSRALDSLARLIASTESFFHPSNSGPWTNDVCLAWNLTT